jgi:hypothetical protein
MLPLLWSRQGPWPKAAGASAAFAGVCAETCQSSPAVIPRRSGRILEAGDLSAYLPGAASDGGQRKTRLLSGRRFRHLLPFPLPRTGV